MKRKPLTALLCPLAVADLERSGLTEAHAAALGMRSLPPAETPTLAPHFKPLAALYIPYWDPERPNAPLTAHLQGPAFFRIRYLETPNDFARVTGGKVQRYDQPVRSGLCAYWPRSADWAAIIKDPTRPIIITEGEKKAAKACLAGHPTIGLGGIWSFRASATHELLLPDLARVDWRQRPVYIIYDSDSSTNPQVNLALWALAEELRYRGALPHVAALPNIYDDDKKKTGLDDYLVAGHALNDVLADAEPLTLARPLWNLNKRVLYIRDPGFIYDRDSRIPITPGAFKEHQYSAESYVSRKLEDDGSVSLRRANVAAAWLTWPLRSTAARLTYRPGEAADCESATGQRELNVWSGWGCAPAEGAVQPFTALVGHLFAGSPKEEKEWFMRWLAYPLQNPGAKLFTAVVMYGRRHGTGKSLVGLTMGRIYGKNFSEISQHDLESGFNEWAQHKQFVLGDDVTGHDRRTYADQLKKMITQRELRINQKFIPSYVIPDCVNYYFTSNQPDAFTIEDDDRRYFVHEVLADPLSAEFYQAYERWLDAEGGAAALFHHLLCLDLDNFNPAAPALRTQAKHNMTYDAKSDLAAWVHQLLADPDAVLRCGEAALPGDLFTARQLLALYDVLGHRRVTANGLGRELKRAGVVHVLGGAQVRTAHGPERYYALRSADKWRVASLNEIKTYLTARGDAPPPKKQPKY